MAALAQGRAPTAPRVLASVGAAEARRGRNRYELRSRAVYVDPLDQTVTLEIRAEKSRGGRILASEEHLISMRGYLRDELLLMLERAGFADVDVHGGYVDQAATADDDFLVYVART
jgi:hypothetical protein